MIRMNIYPNPYYIVLTLNSLIVKHYAFSQYFLLLDYQYLIYDDFFLPSID